MHFFYLICLAVQKLNQKVHPGCTSSPFLSLGFADDHDEAELTTGADFGTEFTMLQGATV